MCVARPLLSFLLLRVRLIQFANFSQVQLVLLLNEKFKRMTNCSVLIGKVTYNLIYVYLVYELGVTTYHKSQSIDDSDDVQKEHENSHLTCAVG